MKTEDKLLADYQSNADENWGRLVILMKKYFDYWALKTIRPHWNEMKLSYMPVISNVSLKGSTSNEIAKRSLTAKQALSVTIKELEQKKMVVTTVAKRDKRSHKINLTEQGKKLMLVANQEINGLTVPRFYLKHFTNGRNNAGRSTKIRVKHSYLTRKSYT